jgi:hypothetical protein
LGGLGLVAVGISAYFGVRAASTWSDTQKVCTAPATGTCTNANGVALSRDAATQATVSTVSLIAGAALMGAGVALFVLSPPPSAANGTSLSLRVGRDVRLEATF